MSDSQHADLEFHVTDCAGAPRIFRMFSEAAGFAISVACSGRESAIDVVCWSIGAALAWGGDAAAESYRQDPDASVHERIKVTAESLGRVA